MDELSPAQAAAAIRQLEGWDLALKRRTLGITWMLWGTITPAIFITFALAARAFTTMPRWFGGLWIPWALAGILLNALLWRSIGMVLPPEARSPRAFALHVGLFFALTVGLVALTLALGLPIYPPATVLGGIGIASALVGIARIRARELGEGVVHLLAGVVMLSISVGGSIAVAGRPFLDGIAALGTLNAITSGVALYATGLYLYSRG